MDGLPRADAIRAESLHFHGLRQGYHHERCFERLGPIAEALLGHCFCDHCRAAAHAAGVPADEVRAQVRREIRAVLDDETATPDALTEMADGALAAYVDVSTTTVTSLAAGPRRPPRQAACGRRLSFMDGGGPDSGWLSGIDLPALAEVVPRIETLGYAQTAAQVRGKVAAFALHGVPPSSLAVILRPMAEDCDSAENLAAKVDTLCELGVPEVEFYHYGLMRLSSLDRIGAALGHTR